MNKPLRVLQLLPMFAIGGAELLVLNLARATASASLEPHICALFDRGVTALRPELDTLQIPVHCFFGRRLYSPTLFRRVADYVRRHQIDMIHTHLLPADIVGRLVGRMLRIPVVSTLHSVPEGFARARPDRRWLERVTATHLADQLVAVAESIRRQYIQEWELPHERIAAISNGIPLQDFQHIPERPAASGEHSGPAMLTIGRLIPDKGHDVLIDAARIVLQRRPNTQFVLVGDGPERERLVAQARDSGIASQVRFTGMRRDIPELLAQCDIFVLPSRREGLPLTAVEAMAAARPVVVTDVGGNRELVAHGVNGLVVPPADPHLLAQTMLDLIEHPEQRLTFARAGRDHVLQHFSVSTMAQRYEAIYTRLAAKPHRGVAQAAKWS